MTFKEKQSKINYPSILMVVYIVRHRYEIYNIYHIILASIHP